MEKFKYMIMSHGRCGSMLCSFLLNEYIKSKTNADIDDYFVLNVETKIIEDYSTKDHVIYHSHNMTNLLTLPNDYTIIFPVRNIFDTVISKAFAVAIDRYKFFHSDLSNLKDMEPFSIDPKEFLDYYNYNRDWHRDCKILLSKFTKQTPIFLDYSDIENNNENFYNLVGLDFKLTERSRKNITVKVPYDYSKIITNYNDLKEYHISYERFTNIKTKLGF